MTVTSTGGNPQKLRIGASKYGYNYTLFAPGIYQCARGSDSAPAGFVLWLEKVNNTWVAYDAPSGGGVRRWWFGDRTETRFHSCDDILVPGWPMLRVP